MYIWLTFLIKIKIPIFLISNFTGKKKSYVSAEVPRQGQMGWVFVDHRFVAAFCGTSHSNHNFGFRPTSRLHNLTRSARKQKRKKTERLKKPQCRSFRHFFISGFFRVTRNCYNKTTKKNLTWNKTKNKPFSKFFPPVFDTANLSCLRKNVEA